MGEGTMNGYAVAYLILTFVSLGVSLGQHGQPKTGNHNFWASLIGTALCLWLVYNGGLFNGV
jgi:hypothetical protein